MAPWLDHADLEIIDARDVIVAVEAMPLRVVPGRRLSDASQDEVENERVERRQYI